MNGKKTAKTIKKKFGDSFYSDISKKRKTFSGGKTFADKTKAREAQRRSVISRRWNKQLREAQDEAQM